MITQFAKQALNIILPPQPIDTITPEDFLIQTEIARRTPPHVQEEWLVAPLMYRKKLVKKTVHALKFKGSTHAAGLLAQQLHPLLLEYMSDLALFQNSKQALLVPIPLSKKRLRERGYNQAFLLASALEKQMKDDKCKILNDVLIRIKHTPAQTKTKSRKERLKNVSGCFLVTKPELIREKTIVLIDDVITTGATMNEARRTLLASGASDVLALSAAH